MPYGVRYRIFFFVQNYFLGAVLGKKRLWVSVVPLHVAHSMKSDITSWVLQYCITQAPDNVAFRRIVILIASCC